MTMKTCDREDCNEQFDLDNDCGVIKTIIQGTEITSKVYCSKECEELDS